MKKLVSLFLTGVLTAGALASCAVPKEGTLSAKVGVASSDAAEYGSWLEERLENIPDDVIVGIGDSAEYAVDMTEFEDDGYIIRKNGDEIVIFGKTSDGLDRGVRKYANTVEMGGEVEDIAYHEGYRIEELKLFGTDISEFAIVHTNKNANMTFAASELCMLIEKACGAKLPIVVEEGSERRRIELRHTDDETLHEDGYRYFEENGNLIIEGAVDRGCLNGVYRFLQNECGWEGLIYGDSYLNEADLIDVPAGLSESEVPIFEYINTFTNAWAPCAYVTDRTDVAWNSVYNSYGSHGYASHGMYHNQWLGRQLENWNMQICYTSEGNYEILSDNVFKYIDNHVAAGGVVGVTLKDIDISQLDNNYYCHCQNCYDVIAEDGSDSGPLLRFANRLAEDLDERYPGANIGVHIFAYFATKIPPKVTTAHDNVYITFASNGNCFNHPLNGSECEPSSDKSGGYLVTDSNVDHNEWLRGWCNIAKNVTVWHYALDSVLQQYTILDVLLDDFRYFDELGVRGLFWQNTYHGFGIKRVEQQLGAEINWHKDMTDEEYEAELCRMLEREYGDGWRYVREYIDLWIEATDRIGCSNCWGYGDNCDPEYDPEFVRLNFETMTELIDNAVRLAGSEKQEYRAKLLSCSVYYDGIFSSYFTAYEAYDDERIAELSELYEFVYDRIVELGFDPKAVVSVDNGTTEVYPTLEEEAWLVWKDEREHQVGSTDLRPEPDWVTALETEEA